jgi:phosphoglycerate dehydrogenase-like enzyme
MKLALAGGHRHRVVVTQPLDDAAIERLDRFFDVALCSHTGVMTREALSEQLRSAAAALVGECDVIDARMLDDLDALQAVCCLCANEPHMDIAAMTRAGVRAMSSPDAGRAVENLVAAFGFGRLGGRPPDLLNPELLCDCCSF